MIRAFALAIIALVSAGLLSGCLESETEKRAKIDEQKSKDFWDMGGPTDRSKSKGYTP
ncbi:hypothetical protein [Pseudomonas oryzicola]|uniref:Entry exclusion lipoprotein TrbK n=1 Tax=Pseudomonas oryzicola TaxID=485876 RepID=A0ABS6QCL8_9PSED|nr:hypothetical protein [Pseudomonas oryzicola]MBV4491939.1 hypothetical protein [Pseudomonas oryzicola]